MILRGITLDRSPYEFTIYDCPVRINDKHTALVNKINSPILVTDTIVYGDGEGLYESDFAFNASNKFVGFVVYVDRFYVYDIFNKELIPYSKEFHTSFNGGSKFVKEFGKIRYGIVLKASGIVFDLSVLVCVDKGKIRISTQLMKEIPISNLRYCTGLTFGKRPIAFGDGVSDGIVELHNYHPMVKMDTGEYRELRSSEYDS